MQTAAELTKKAQTYVDKYKRRLRDGGYVALSNIMRDIHDKVKDRGETYNVKILTSQFALIDTRHFHTFFHDLVLRDVTWNTIYTVVTMGRTWESSKTKSEELFRKTGVWRDKMNYLVNDASMFTTIKVSVLFDEGEESSYESEEE